MSSNIPVSLKHDDYLPCKSYRGHAAAETGIYKFTAEGKFYFSFIENGLVILRSEGYTSEGGRENGILSILKNKENEDQYKIVMLEDGTWVSSLVALNHQEIARSCPVATEAEARALLPGARAIARESLLMMSSTPAKADVPVKVAALLSAEVHLPEDKEDDYLLCKEYQGHLVTDKQNNVALFMHQNGQFYFAVYHYDDSVRLRSEGFASTTDRDHELAAVIRYINSPSHYSTIEKSGYEIKVLKDNTGREIGRSCPKRIVVAIPPATVVAPSKEGGFQWWWLLALLLLLALFFWWKSCNQSVAEVSPAVETPVPVEVVKDTDGDGINDDTDKCPNVAGIAGNLGCPEMILYYKRVEAALSADDKADLDKVVTFLNNNPNVHVILEGHTSTLGETDYNQTLSEKRVNNSVAYLVEKGIDPGRLKAVGYGEQFPIGDNSTEEGRAQSRRTVIKVDQ